MISDTGLPISRLFFGILTGLIVKNNLGGGKMDEKKLAWQMFIKTGNPSYYSLFKRLSEGNDDAMR